MASINPIDGLTALELKALLKSLSVDEDSPRQKMLIEQQIDALVPALVELRDGGHQDLNMRVVAELAMPHGFERLSRDARLSESVRHRCAEVCRKMAEAEDEQRKWQATLFAA